MNASAATLCDCLDDCHLTQFSIGCLTTLDQEKVESHLENCEACLARLSAINDRDDFVELLQRVDTEHERGIHRISTRKTVTFSLQVSHRYHLREIIGSGGMSVVWSAHDRLLNREVALKVIGEDHQTNPDLLARFERESLVVARLQHPGIPPIYELARLPDGRPFLAMKRVVGQTLCDEGLIGRHPDVVLDVFQQICQTVAFAHSLGIVHRDLKPDNIMIGEFGEIQVMDWGIAEEVSAGDELVAMKVAGTPAYMSPEQAIGLQCGRRSDVYSLGLLLCDMLTGEALQPNELATTIRNSDEERESLVRRVGDSGIDERLMLIIEDCVRFEPTARPRDAAELADRISAYSLARQEDLRQTELIHATQRARAQQRRQRSRLGFLMTGLLVVVLAIYGNSLASRAARREKTRVSIRQAIAESITIRESVRQSKDLQEAQIREAISAATNAQVIAAESDELALEQQAQELVGMLNAELQDIRSIKRVLDALEQGLRIESEETVAERYQQVVARRQNKIQSGQASAFVFLNTPRYGNSSPFRPSTRTRVPRKDRDAVLQDFGPLAHAYRTIFRFGEQRRVHYKTAFDEFGVRTSDGEQAIAQRVSGLKTSVREKIVSGIRLWFLFSAEFQHADSLILASALAQIDEQLESRTEILDWRRAARTAIFERDVPSIDRLCTEGIPQISDHPEELIWGLGCYESLFFKRQEHRFLRLGQRHFLGSFLLNNELADRYTKSHTPSRAVPYLNTAIAAIPSRRLRLALARRVLHSHDIDEFYALRDQCLRAHGNEPSYLLEWADIMSMSHVLPKSDPIEMYQRTIDLGFEFPQLALARIGQIHYREGDLLSALEFIVRARKVEGLAEEERIELDEAIEQIEAEIIAQIDVPR